MLREQIYEITYDPTLKTCRTMGQVLNNALEFVKRNYEDVSMKQILENKIQV